MKKRIKKRLSFLLLTLLGFSTACEKQKNGEPPTAMYGTPHVNIWVGGKVTDKTGTPIPGIEVRQQNSSYKAQTGDDGCYELPGQLFSIETTADILFTDTDGPSNGGEFAAQSVPVEFTEADRVSEAEGWCGGSFAHTGVDVTLEEDATMIGEVVAIGYGSQRKEDLSMAVTTVKLDEAAKSRASNLATILQGRMPGVTVQQTGDPMKPASFTIRGRGSKGNDDDPTSGDGVLVVVDGVPNAPYMMEDVETITVLKDAASAAIYGASVGSSGVILITTKKAQSGKLRVDVNVSLGFEKVTNLPKMLTAEQYNEVWAKTVEKNPGSQLPSASNPEVYPWGNVTRMRFFRPVSRSTTPQRSRAAARRYSPSSRYPTTRRTACCSTPTARVSTANCRPTSNSPTGSRFRSVRRSWYPTGRATWTPATRARSWVPYGTRARLRSTR